MKKIALISDIHGNSFALKAVLNHMGSTSLDLIINLGDTLYGPLDPYGTFELVTEINMISISGNQDRIIREHLDRPSSFATLEYVKSQINHKIAEWLMQLPFHQVIDNDIYAFHASPHGDSEYLLEQTHADFNAVKHLNEIESQLKGIEQKIIVCGHSHISRIVQTENHLVINPGSVGLPAYSDDLPVFHKMQNFNPRACYAMLLLNENSVSIERYSVDYDFESAAQLAEKNNRNDWAQWIRTGKA